MLCRYAQRHNINIDLAFNTKGEKTVEEYFPDLDLSLIFTAFENCFKTNQKGNIQI